MPSTTATLRAGLYSRESKDKLKSIDDQAAEGREAAACRGWVLAAEYSDGTSASRFGRKVRQHWLSLLADLDAGLLDVVITWEPSRADRDLETWVAFVSRCRAKGALVHLVTDDDTLDPRNPSHWHRLITGGVDAAMESEKVSRRTRRGTARAAAAGKPHGPAPFGYERVIVGEEQTPHGPKPVKEQRKSPAAPVVVEIFERVARNDPLAAIVRDLNERGLPGPKGGPWNRDTLRDIARNVAYLGQRRHRSERDGQAPTDNQYQGTWPSLVDAAQFHRAQAVLDRPDRKKTKPGAARWLMSYIVHAPCGKHVHASPERTGRAARYVCAGDGCVSVAVRDADEIMARIVCGRFGKPDLLDLFAPDDTASRAAKVEAAELRTTLDRHYDEAAAGRLSAGGLTAMERRLLPLIEDADRRSRPTSAPGPVAELIDAAKVSATRIRQVWDSLPLAARREVIVLLADVVIGPKPRRLSRWATEEERLLGAATQLQIHWKDTIEIRGKRP
jgi:DNA invertase Pin-like site-specific DNA recombinase